ncbi:MAG: hypothetical protein A2792_00275 [Sphingomonadales bacterium RIFCSPHIGHO2_01_FULL_65_20]|nr:MAG: hypothetical protein A2792_00275 [Sphingomonadales bacterium RIFCSPHIGHO2_01_FULL_65_20]
MGRPLSWSPAEQQWLRENYARLGRRGCAEHLGRTRGAVGVIASRLNLRTTVTNRARRPSLAGDQLEEAIRLHEQEGWSFERLGHKYGYCETAVSNAVLMALCPRKGHRPAARNEYGRLMPEEIERMRLMLRKGLKGVDIQLRMGVSAACVAEQRRRYRDDLKARDKAPLPPPGNGERYSGVRVAKADRRRVEELLLQGYGGPRASRMTGVSKTVCTRIRAALVKRLARKGENLPGCDIDGRRLTQRAGARNIAPEQIVALKRLLLDGIPVRRAGNLTGIGLCSAYRFRDELNADRAAQGLSALPRAFVNTTAGRKAAKAAEWLDGPQDIVRLRQLIIELGYDAAIPAMKAEIRQREIDARAAREAERIRPKTFEETLARVRAGAAITIRQPIRKADPAYTLGGVATGAL